VKKVVIIGAGPAGITAAYELVKKGGHEITLLEQSGVFGGISRTVNVDGDRMDIGGHRFFSKDKRVTDWWYNILPTQGKPSSDDILFNRHRQFASGETDPETEDLVMLKRSRVSRIYFNNKLFDYPVSLNRTTLRNIGFYSTLRAAISYLATLLRKLPEENLENFYINRFGKVLYRMFFEGYTEKLWGRHPREISAEWGAQRVKGLSIKTVIKDMIKRMFRIKNRNTETSLINEFDYPKYGPGQLWTVAANEVKRMGGTVLTGKKVVSLKLDDNGKVCAVTCSDDCVYFCDELISSMPVKDLINLFDTVPAEVKKIASGLPYRDFQTAGVLIPADKFLLKSGKSNSLNEGAVQDKGISSDESISPDNRIAPDCWIYVQDAKVKLGRIQIFNNWSPYLLNDFKKTVWLGLEYYCSKDDEYWQMPDNEFIDFAVSELVETGIISFASDVIKSHREKVGKAYPAYYDTYSGFSVLREFLDSIPNLYCVGRNGQHRYNNMDHSMLTAFEAVDCIVNNRTGKSSVWNINTENDYHESKIEKDIDQNVRQYNK